MNDKLKPRKIKNWIKRSIELYGELDFEFFTKKQVIKTCREQEKRNKNDLIKCPVCGKYRNEEAWSEECGLVETYIRCGEHWKESWYYGVTEKIVKFGNYEHFCEYRYNSKNINKLDNEYENALKKVNKLYKKRIKYIANRNKI